MPYSKEPTTQRQALAMWFEPCRTPIAHGLPHHPEPFAVALSTTRTIATKGRRRGELAGVSRSQSQRPVCLPVRRRVEILALESRDCAVDGALTPARNPTEGIHCREPKGNTIGRSERAGEARNQRV